MGGRPSKGTSKDKRLTANKPKTPKTPKTTPSIDSWCLITIRDRVYMVLDPCIYPIS